MSETQYTVEGMTCGHCAAAVSAEVGAVAGVRSVNVDLEARLVTVDGHDVAAADVRAAVEEAGYRVVDV